MHSHSASSSQILLLIPNFAEWEATTQYFPCIQTRESPPRERWAEREEPRCLHHSDQQRCGRGGQAHIAPRKLRRGELWAHPQQPVREEGLLQALRIPALAPRKIVLLLRKWEHDSVLFTSGWQIGTGWKSPLKETNLLLEGFLEHVDLLCLANTCLALGRWFSRSSCHFHSFL